MANAKLIPTVIVTKEIASMLNAILESGYTATTKERMIMELMVREDLVCFEMKIPLRITNFEQIDLN